MFLYIYNKVESIFYISTTRFDRMFLYLQQGLIEFFLYIYNKVGSIFFIYLQQGWIECFYISTTRLDRFFLYIYNKV